MASTIPGLAAIASVAAASLYGLGAALQIRSLRHDQVPPLGTVVLVTVPALVLHGTAAYLQVNTEAGVYLGFFTAASLIILLMILFLVLASARLPVQNLLVLALPLGTVAVLASLLGETAFEARRSLAPALALHIAFSLLAYSILFMAACQSVLLTFQERALRSPGSLRVLRLLPPLETMKALLFTLLWTGILTLTVAILICLPPGHVRPARCAPYWPWRPGCSTPCCSRAGTFSAGGAPRPPPGRSSPSRSWFSATSAPSSFWRFCWGGGTADEGS